MFISGVCRQVTNSHQAVGAQDPSLEYTGWGNWETRCQGKTKRVVEKMVENKRTQNDTPGLFQNVWGQMMSNGCFQKYGYPQIIHFNRVFHYKPSILVVFPLFLETPKFWKAKGPFTSGKSSDLPPEWAFWGPSSVLGLGAVNISGNGKAISSSTVGLWGRWLS